MSVFHEDGHLRDLRTIVSSYRDFTQDLVRSKKRYKAILGSRGSFHTSRTIYDDISILESISGDEEQFVAQRLFAQIE